MKLTIYLAVAIFVAVIVLWCQSGTAASSANKLVWHVVQETYEVGRVSSFAGEDGVRIDMPKVGLAIIASAPSWHPYILNSEEKLYFPITLQRLRTEGVVPEMADMHAESPDLNNPDLWTAAKSEPTTVLGVKALRTCTKVNFQLTDWGPSLSGANKHLHVSALQYYSAVDCKVPTAAVEVIRAAYKLPAEGGLPLALVYTIEGRRCVSLDPIQIKQVRVATNQFKVPEDYKQVKRQGDIIGKSKTQALEDWAGDIGLGEHTGSKQPARQGTAH